MIAIFVGTDHRNWNMFVQQFFHVVSTATQATLKASPVVLNYGRNLKPVKILRGKVESKEAIEQISPDAWGDQVKGLDVVHDLVTKHIKDARSKQESYFNHRHRDVRLSEGMQVMKRTHHQSDVAKKFLSKLAPKFETPYVAVKLPVVFVLHDGNKEHVARFSDIKWYIPGGKHSA